MIKKSLVIIGASGFIGSKIYLYLIGMNPKDTQILGTFNKNKEYDELIHLDVTQHEELSKFFKNYHPDIILVTSGIKDVKVCEDDYDLAYSLNTQPIIDIINIIESGGYNTQVIYLSTDYVFSGKSGSYTDNDIPNPRTNYGKTKYLSELALNRSNTKYTIIRISAVLGQGSNFFDWITSLLKNNQNIELFDDIYFSPTPINFITDTIGEIIENNNEYLYRTIHISGGERISRYQLGQRLKIIMNSESKIIPKKGLNFSDIFQHDLSLIPSKPYIDQAYIYTQNFYKNIYDSSH